MSEKSILQDEMERRLLTINHQIKRENTLLSEYQDKVELSKEVLQDLEKAKIAYVEGYNTLFGAVPDYYLEID